MSKVKKLIDILHDISVFYMYQSANIPAVIAFAKKKAQDNAETWTNKELLTCVNERARKFVRSISPSKYKNIMTLLRASVEKQENGIELLQKYREVSKEHRSDMRYEDTFDEDTRMRIAIAYVDEFYGKNRRLPGRADLDKTTAYYYGTAMCMVNGYRTYKIAWHRTNKFTLQDADNIAKTIFDIGVENGDEDGECKSFSLNLREMMAWHNVPFADFSKTAVSEKDVRKICRLSYLHYLEDTGVYKELSSYFKDSGKLKKDLSEEEVKAAYKLRGDIIDDVIDRCVYGTAIYKLIVMYAEARNIANDSLDKISELEARLEWEKDRNVTEEIKEANQLEADNNAASLKEKQKRLNKLQADNDRLTVENKDLEEENKFLRTLLQNEDEPEEEADKPIEESASYPKGAILFGGHESWQRRFSAIHPDIKIMSGVNEGFPENVLSRRTPLVLLNSRYMSHKVFFKIRALQKRMKFKIEYI